MGNGGICICVVILALLGALLAGIWFGFLPPPGASMLIRIRNGRLFLRGCHLPARTREDVIEILTQKHVSSGFIAVTAERRVSFSRQIPKEIHQRLRNVLFNP